MRNILVMLLATFAISCVSTSPGRGPAKISSSEYIELEKFCKKNNSRYNFDTLDEVVWIYSSDKDIKLLLGSSVASFNGTIFYLEKPPLYSSGKIFLPAQLQETVSASKFISFKPLVEIKTIVIDPGHGGKDPGAISRRGLQEKTVNLIIARYLKQELEARGFRVMMTREGDTFLSLSQRVEFARSCNADLFVSVHANSNVSSTVSGSEIYYLLPSKVSSYERSIKLAKSECFSGVNRSPEVETILWDMLITKNYTFSVEFANTLYLAFKNLGFNVKAPRKAPFYVLKYAYVPSVLVETGYLSNSYEKKALRKKHYQKQIAQAIALGIVSLQTRYSVSSTNKQASTP